MCTPGAFTGPHTSPLHNAVLELLGASSALHMAPEPRLSANEDAVYLADTDEWAHHAVEHIRYVIHQLEEEDRKRPATPRDALREAIAFYAKFWDYSTADALEDIREDLACL